MPTLRFILGDQLTREVSSLRDIDIGEDIVVLAEVHDEASYVRHHKKKIAFIFSCMRHFADELRAEGIQVAYRKLDDANDGTILSFTDALDAAVERFSPDRIVVTEAGEWRVRDELEAWTNRYDVPVEIREDDRYLCSHERFCAYADGKKSLRMEFFYREMRRELDFLMVDGNPEGGQWNYDHDNRETLPNELIVPEREHFPTDATTRDCIRLVEQRFGNHFGVLDDFDWPVTREDALRSLDDFVERFLPRFGTYQDAMKEGEPYMFHGLVSPMINIGLLTPMEVCRAVEREYYEGRAPLNAVEGFIRQIIGWREYVRGIYWWAGRDYKNTNKLEAKRNLPDFYWSGQTDLNCLRNAINEIRENAYGHHIQRLMITGNFALIAGVEPAQIEEWYLSVYTDAYEWVELPNVHGMSQYADGGYLASKPYASSGAYINRMSDYCGSCRYKVSKKAGPDACPFNYLYWNFMIENMERLQSNHRMRMPYRTLARMSDERRAEIVSDSRAFLDSLAPWRPD